MAMILGGYTFALNPLDIVPVVSKVKRAAALDTLGGVAYFSWGTFYEGQIVPLKWNQCSTAQFNSLKTLFENDAEVVWNPEDGNTYNVEILSLTGDFHFSASGSAPYRKNVVMQLIIMSKV